MPQSDNIILKKGAQTTLSFEGKSTTGYEWTVSIEGDKCISIEKSFQPQSIFKMGESAKEVFNITALSKGSATLNFYLNRNWEKEAKPVKQSMFTVEVE